MKSTETMAMATGGERAGSFAAALAQAIPVAGTLLALKIIATTAGPAALGAYALGLAVAGTATMLAFGPIAQMVLRYRAGATTPPQQAALALAVLRPYGKALGFSALAAALVALATLLPLPMATLDAELVGQGLLLGAAAGSLLLVSTLAAARSAHFATAAIAFLDHGLRIAFFLLAPALGSGDFLGWHLLATSCALLAVLLFASPHWRPVLAAQPARADPAERERYTAYLKPFFAFAGFAALAAFGDRYILGAACGAACVGQYFAAFTIASGGVVFAYNVVTQVAAPRAFSGERVLSAALQAFAGLALAGAAIGVLLGEAVMALFTSGAFDAAAGYLGPLVVALAIFHAAQLLTLRGLVAEDPQALLRPKALHAFAVVLLGLPLTLTFGAWGMVAALAIAALAYLLLVLHATREMR